MAEKNNQIEMLDKIVQEFLAAQLRGEELALDEFVRLHPGIEKQIRQKVHNCQQVSSLFDSLREVDVSEFKHPKDEIDLIGKRLGSFEIIEIIGRGGMGVVYKGHDTRLDRIVAIKALPRHLVEDATACKRFRREATLLASLNHTNIGVIYDIVEQEDGTDYLVLEHVQGKTLAEHIAREPLKLEEALSIGQQIAEAVSAAHEEGVIHRDLKPSNIKITPVGKVKVLDFGLAKTAVSKSATAEPSVTQVGRVMGTPAYMSPEQARGNALDRRTDIWSFGCLLYEMLTGHQPFEGSTTTDVLARIIERKPDWDLLPQTTPPNIRVLLWRCLAKDPRRRVQHMGDVVLEIDESLNLPPDKPRIDEAVVKVGRRRTWWLTTACSIAGVIFGLTVASIFLSRSTITSHDTVAIPTQRTVIRLPDDQVLAFYQTTTFGLRKPAFALSPDGSRLVYVARVADTTQLFERLMNQYAVRPIAGTNGASSPFFSPDSQSVGFFVQGQLKIVSLQGGEPVTLCSAEGCGSWSNDGMIYFFRDLGLSRVPSRGGNEEQLGVEFDGIGNYPQVLPGGKAVLVSSSVGAELVSLETMEKKVLARDVLYARYLPTGHLIYVRAGAIEAVPFSLDKLKETGSRVPVIESVLSDSVYGSAQFAFSNNGSLVYVRGGDTGKSIPIWIDRHGKAQSQSLNMPAQIYGTPRLSPDGKRLAILVQELQSNVFVYDIATGMPTRLILEGNYNGHVWTLDSKKVILSCGIEKENEWNLFWAQADGSGKAELLYSSQQELTPCSWYPDGKRLMICSRDISINTLSIDKPHEFEHVFKTDFVIHQVVLSPDGKYIAYTSNKEGDFNVYVSPYPEFNWIKRISLEFGEEPLWSNKGDELFYRNREKWMVASISTEPEFKAGKPQVIFEGPYINVGGLSYNVSTDSERFLVLKPQYDDSQVRELQVISNWFEELKRLAPSSEAP
jgi:serine/threonine-protein kinase